MGKGRAQMDDVERGGQIEEVVTPVLRDHGLQLVDLEWRALRPRSVLRLYVDKPGGVGIGACERASREIGDVRRRTERGRRARHSRTRPAAPEGPRVTLGR